MSTLGAALHTVQYICRRYGYAWSVCKHMNRPIRFMTQVDEYARGLSLVATSWWRGMQNAYFSLASGGFNFSLTPYATHEMTLKTAAFELETHFSNLFRILQLIIRMVVAFVACGCLHSTKRKKNKNINSTDSASN